MSGNFSSRMSVANLAALKAIENPPPDAIRAARDTSPAGDNSRDAGWYVFRAGDSTAEDLPDIVEPTTGNGRWRSFVGGDVSGGGAAIVSGDFPDRAPQQAGELWIVLGTGSVNQIVSNIFLGVLTDGSLDGGLNVDGGAWIDTLP